MHYYVDPTSERQGNGGGSGGSLRSPAGSRCAPAAPGGVTFDGQAYVSRPEAVHADGSGSSAEAKDREEWSRAGTVVLHSGRIRGATPPATQGGPGL